MHQYHIIKKKEKFLKISSSLITFLKQIYMKQNPEIFLFACITGGAIGGTAVTNSQYGRENVNVRI